MPALDLSGERWRKSSRSTDKANYVEVDVPVGTVAVATPRSQLAECWRSPHMLGLFSPSPSATASSVERTRTPQRRPPAPDPSLSTDQPCADDDGRVPRRSMGEH